MNIAFYCSQISNGGFGRVISILATQFCANGHNVTLILDYKTDSEYYLDRNIKQRYLSDVCKMPTPLLRNLQRITYLRKFIDECAPDLVITFSSLPSFRTLVACHGRKYKKCFSFRNDPKEECKSFFMKHITHYTFNRADGLVFQTEEARAWFSEKAQKRSIIISNPISPVFFNRQKPKDVRNIATAGRLEPQKNQKLLIRAYSKIAHLTDDDLIIYGSGSMLEQLQKLAEELKISDRVVFAGQVTDLDEKLLAAKMFVLSSDYEGMPNALMESMALGLPCISTDCPCGGSALLIKNGENGFLTPVGDEDALAAAMTELLTNPALSKRLQENATKSVKRFLPETIYTQWYDYIKHIVDKPIV